jgi:hypothetical protein
MKKAHAALAAVVGLTLTATGAVAASTAISSLAMDHSAVGGANDNHDGVVSTLATSADHTQDASPNTDTTSAADAQGAHGAAVSTVAQDQTAIGGPNDNHGGAVSLVARGTHGSTATHGKSAGKSQAGAHESTH